MKRPSFQFYPADWRNDAALRMCSLAARGLWWEMVCVMHTSEPYGHLVAAGRPIEPADLARIVGESAKDVVRWLAELDRHAIYSKTEHGVMFCRRMVRDEIERGQWRERQDRSRGKAPIVTPVVTPHVTEKSRRPSSSPSSSSSSSSAVQKETPTVPVGPVVALAPITALPIQIPHWVPVEPWEAFVAMRKRIKKPLTTDALKVLLAKLIKFHAAGHDIGAILEESILNQWQSVFAPKPEGTTHGKAPAHNSFGSTLTRVVRKRAGEGLFASGDEIAGELAHSGTADSPVGEDRRLGPPIAAE